MNALPAELRLAIAIIVNVLLLLGCFRAIKRLTHRAGFIVMMDTLLLDYLIQYMAVCGLGLLHSLTPETLYTVVTIISILLIWFARRGKSMPEEPVGHRKHQSILPRFNLEEAAPFIGLFFLIGYFIALINTIGGTATVSDDALMYHLPIPAIWLQDHRLTFFATWFSNPANSYSPLAVETFITWLMALVGNDLLAHFVQVPGLLLLYLASIAVMEAVQIRRAIAVPLAIALILSRPFISQSILVKDDLFVASFFMVIIGACRNDLLNDRFGAWRLGVASGLFFATKYTALQSAPVLLLLIDAPYRAKWTWSKYAIVLLLTALLAGPWYLRNFIVTGNPLYPVPLVIHGVQVFKGLFFPSPSPQMHTLAGIWSTLTTGYQGMGKPLTAILIFSALLSVGLFHRALRREPLIRTCSIGSLLGLLLFFLISHAPEIRYAYPSLALLFLSFALTLSWISRASFVAIGVAIIFAAISIWNGFDATAMVAEFVVMGMIVCLAAAVVQRSPRQIKISIIGAASLAVAGWIYVNWNSTVERSRNSMLLSLSQSYAELTPAWAAALGATPGNSPIAYTNLALIRPAMGFGYEHRIVYVPVKANLIRPDQLPSSNIHLTEPQFRPFIAQLLQEGADGVSWKQRLFESKAGSLIIGKPDYAPDPAELTFANDDPAHFQKVFENSSSAVYQIHP